jgi:hypothetical protein
MSHKDDIGDSQEERFGGETMPGQTLKRFQKWVKGRTALAVGSTFVLLGAAGMVLTVTGQPNIHVPSGAVQAKPIMLRHHERMQLHQRRNQSVSESYNWSGYALTGTRGSVTDVKASWVVPSAGSCSTVPDGYASFWAGIDGWNSNTVEQIGTDSDCVNLTGTQTGTPTYYAWFEFYPQYPFLIGNYTNAGVCETDCIYPGDYISAEVKSGSSGLQGGPRSFRVRSIGQQFTVTITDKTRGWSFTTTASVTGAQQSSAEWIAETPYGCNTASGYCYLTDFGIADYGEAYTPFPDTASATVSGKTGGIGTFGSTVQQAIMVSYPSGTYTMADPSPLGDGDTDTPTSFTDTWKNAGP